MNGVTSKAVSKKPTDSAICMMKLYAGEHRVCLCEAHLQGASAPLWCKPFLYTNQSRAQFGLNFAQWHFPPGHLYCKYIFL